MIKFIGVIAGLIIGPKLVSTVSDDASLQLVGALAGAVAGYKLASKV